MISGRMGLGLVLSTGLLFSMASAQDRPGKSVEGWGTVVDPDGDCQVRQDGAKLTITVPGTLHDLSIEIGKVNAPRVVADVATDCIAEVHVSGPFRPAGPCTRPQGIPYHGAGLLLWRDEQNYIRLERATVLRPNGELFVYVNFEARAAGQLVEPKGGQLPDQPVRLRLEHRDGKAIGSVSLGGGRWSPLGEYPFEESKGLKIGVAAVSSSSNAFAAELSDYALFTRATPGAARR